MMRSRQVSLPVLLEAPRFHSRLPVLGKLDRSWEEITVSSNADERLRLAAQFEAVKALRVGGDYMHPVADHSLLPGRVVLVLPEDRADASTAWRRALAGWGAASLCVYAPFLAGHQLAVVQRRAKAFGVRLLSRAVNPHSLIESCDVVLVHEMNVPGLIGLAHGKAVWRLNACGPVPESYDKAASAVVALTTYNDPYNGQECRFSEIVSLLAGWRTIVDENRQIAAAMGMAWWKRSRMCEFLSNAPGAPQITRRTSRALRLAERRSGAIACWSTRVSPALLKQAETKQLPIWRIEDGFIRSLGLGSDFLPPSSIVMDKRGIYYDPSVQSDLETILLTHTFNAALLQRARCLTDRIVQDRISKYGASTSSESRISPAARSRAHPRVILVPGQVSDDQSVLRGGAGLYSNLELIRRVRAVEPEAWIIYRPHPDVDAGHRAGAVADTDALRFANEIHRGGAMPALLGEVDEVHTLTSLTGFEALMRGMKVSVWGQPFYAGWGLTTDYAAPVERRNRILTLEELVAATLIIYPRYIDPLTQLPCMPETLISRLNDPDLWRPGLKIGLRRAQGTFMKTVTKFCHDVARVLQND